jgi:competence protein ComEC
VIAPVLRARRREDVALTILSHPHPDHFGGLPTGLATARVGALWDTGQGERESVGGGYATLLDGLRARGVPVLRPEAFCGRREIAGVVIDVLAPCPATLPDRGPNDNSIVLRITYGRRAFLFVGDTEHEAEGDLLRSHPELLRADVLKVGHHGSRTSSTPAFLGAVAPAEAVISAGARNRFGHPHRATLDALAEAGARLWRTDRDGSVTIRTDGESLDVQIARNAR